VNCLPATAGKLLADSSYPSLHLPSCPTLANIYNDIGYYNLTIFAAEAQKDTKNAFKKTTLFFVAFVPLWLSFSVTSIRITA
jgi:hypothetical protein